MRGPARTKAAFWLVPALASAASLPPAYFSIPSAFVSLPLFSDDTRDSVFETNQLNLRVDVLESQDPCNYANITVNGQALPKEGHGAIAYDPWTSMVATWTSACDQWSNTPREQLLNLVIDSVNGSIVQDLRLRVLYQQIAPVWISQVDGGSPSTRTVYFRETVPSIDEPASEGLESEIASLTFLRNHAAELAELIEAKERHL